MLASTSQVLLRNQALFEQGKWLLANIEDSQVFAELSHSNLWGFHQYFDVYQQCEAFSAERHHFGAAYLGDDPADLFDGAVMVLPKAKAHARMLLANLANRVKLGGKLLVVGRNDGGGRGAGKLLSEWGEPVIKLDSARCCSLYQVILTQTQSNFVLDDYLQPFSIEVGGVELLLASLPGVFSHGQLDEGTQLLLGNCSDVPDGKLLDFACGCGVIGCFLAKHNPNAEVTLSDINALALYSAKISATLNKLNVNIVPSNGLQALAKNYQAIYTNPPFHQGVKTDYLVTRTFIEHVSQHLTMQGMLMMVANRFLSYPNQLGQQMKLSDESVKTNKFSLYQAYKH